MKTEEFVPISEDRIVGILRERHGYTDEEYRGHRRREPRWPFLGTVELWVPDADGEEEYLFAQALNLSPQGVGILIDEDLPLDREISIAIHEPEATLHGKAIVRHSAPISGGYHIGLQFLH